MINRAGRTAPALILSVMMVVAMCAAEWSRLLSADVANMSAIWPSLGIAVGVGLVLGRRVALWYGLAVMAWLWIQSLPPWVILLTGIQQSFEALVAIFLLQRYLHRPVLLDNVSETIRFYLFGALLPTLPLTFASSIVLARMEEFATFSWLDIWLVFWLAEVLGIMLFAPLAQRLVLGMRAGERVPVPTPRTALFIFLLLFLLVFSLMTISPETGHYSKILSYLFFPLLAWAAMSGQKWMALAGTPAVGIVVPALGLASIPVGALDGRFELVEAVVLVALMTVMTQMIQATSRERQRLLRTFQDQAQRDLTSGLLNDRGLIDLLQTRSDRYPKVRQWVGVLELRNFDDARQLLEADFSNQIERFVSARLEFALGSRGSVARLGPGLFGFLVSGARVDDFHGLVQALWTDIHGRVYQFGGRAYRLAASVGTVAHMNDTSPETSLAAAGLAARVAKRSHGLPVYHSSTDDEIFRTRQDQLRRLEQLKAALDEDRLILFCQEIRALDTATDERAVEILVRMRSKDGNIVAPGEFLPVAQDYGLMGEIDRAVVRKTFEWISQHPSMSSRLDKVAINLSGATLADPGFCDWLEGLQSTCQVPAHRVCFEVTESQMIEDWQVAAELLGTVRRWGYRVSLDDFGTGLATFEYLTRFPFDFVKIDGVFIRDLLSNPVHQSVVASVTNVARTLGLKTIAEFVSDEMVMQRLKELDVDYVQGFGIGRPMPIGEFMLRLQADYSDTAPGQNSA